MPQTLLEWIARMNSIPRARIALKNLFFDARKGRTPRELLHRLRRFIDTEWPARAASSEPDTLIRNFADHDPDHCYCKGQPSPRRPRKSECSRVIDAKTVWAHNLDLAALGFTLKPEVPTKQIQKLEKRGLRGVTLGQMRSLAPFAWITQAEKLERLRKQHEPGEEFATSVRDHLGLTSYLQHQKLVEVRYPSKAVARMEMAPPTFVEGGEAFQSLENEKPDRWGRTFHLRKRKEALPEAVHRPVDFTDDFRLLYVGKPERAEFSFDCDALNDEQIEELVKILEEP